MTYAVIGLAGIFPGAPDVPSFWRNIVTGVDAITDVPASRWDPEFYDPNSTEIDRFYCKRGGFVDAHADFDPLLYGVMPNAAAAIEPEQLLTLRVGYEALSDAGYAEKPIPREKTGIVLGRGNYIGAAGLRQQQHVRMLPQILQTLQDLFPDLPADTLAHIKARLREKSAYYGPDVASGLIPNLAASRLANRLDLHGPAFTIDAACASSLIAVEQACAMLGSGQTDLMLVGGVHLTHDLTFWATFCQLGALSRSGTIRPLAAGADGILAGEGVGVAVLKRLDDALADGDRIYASIEGCGASSDGRSASLVAPAMRGQRIALEKAWSQAGLSRHDVGLVEAHGTGTPTGDAVELETLAQFFGPAEGRARGVIGSVKSMIGHAMPASGMASLIKTALAIHHGVLPPTLHCQTPHKLMEHTRFRAIAAPEAWDAAPEQRIAAVNAFGFGGINSHVVLRGVTPTRRAARLPPPTAQPGLPGVLMLSAASQEGLLAALDAGTASPEQEDGGWRLAVLEPDAKRLATARRAVLAAKPWAGRQGIWFSPGGLLGEQGGKLAFVFPGVGALFHPRTEGLAAYFGAPLPPDCEKLDPAHALARVASGLLGFNAYLFEALTAFGLRPDGLAGHSVGEWSAMRCGGMLDPAQSEQAMRTVDLDTVAFPDLLFLAASCGEDRLLAAIEGLSGIALSHDNCPHQVIACGERAPVAQAAARLREMGVMHRVLPIISGFHSPLFTSHLEEYRAFFSRADLALPRIGVWSATRAAPFPDDLDGRRQLAIDHLLQPVRFRALIEAMYAEGFRVFVEVGTGPLSGFVADTLAGRPHLALPANHEDRGGLAQLQIACAALWVESADFDLRLIRQQAPARTASTVKLDLGVTLLRLDARLEHGLPSMAAVPHLTANADDPVETLMHETLADIARAGSDVMALWRRRKTGETPSPRLRQRRIRMLLDIETTIPYVKDHEFCAQRKNWPIATDRRPVVPLTMEVMLVREAVQDMLPGSTVTAISGIQAYKWLDVSSPVTIEIVLNALDASTVEAEIEGYFKAVVTVASGYEVPDLPPAPALVNPRPTEADPASLYADRWMFHGPAYQGVVGLHAIGDNGVDGALRVTAGKGALLDNMGQLAGYWVMEQPENCLAMPIGVDKIRFFAPDPLPGEITQASIRLTALDALNCRSDHQLRDAAGRLCVSIEGWHTRRYQMDRAFFLNMRMPSLHAVSRHVPDNVMIFEDRYDSAILREHIAFAYLTESERKIHDARPPRGRRQWLAGRVAAKDAVLHHLRRIRGGEVFPAEIVIENDAHGAPHVAGVAPGSLHVSISHKGTLAAAIAGTAPVGIDIEKIELQGEGFLSLVFSAEERALLTGEDPAVAFTRGWVAKEVAAKAAGTGLQSRPLDYVIQARDGDCLRINGHWLVTHLLRDHIIGWSIQT